MIINGRKVNTNLAFPGERAADRTSAAHETVQAIGHEIVLMCQHFYPEMIASGMHMTQLAAALTKLGWGVTVYCASQTPHGAGDPPEEFEYEGIRIRRLLTPHADGRRLLRRGVFGLAFTFACAWTAFRTAGKYDILLLTTDPPFLGLVGCLVSKLRRKPYVLIVYDIYPDIAENLGVVRRGSLVSRLWRRATRTIMNRAACNVVIGRDMAQKVSEIVAEPKRAGICLIPNWSDETTVYPMPRDENPFRREHGLGESWVVQYSGNMGRTHNLECLIDAAGILRDRDIIFQFIGAGAKKEKLEQIAAQRGLKNVRFLPHQPIERLGEVLSAADLAVVCLESCFTGLSVPSKTYGIMASATPILGFLDPDSEIGRLIIETDCGTVLPDPTGEQVAAVITDLLDNPEKLRRWGQNGYRAFQAEYTLSLAAERYSRLLAQVLASVGSH